MAGSRTWSRGTSISRSTTGEGTFSSLARIPIACGPLSYISISIAKEPSFSHVVKANTTSLLWLFCSLIIACCDAESFGIERWRIRYCIWISKFNINLCSLTDFFYHLKHVCIRIQYLIKMLTQLKCEGDIAEQLAPKYITLSLSQMLMIIFLYIYFNYFWISFSHWCLLFLSDALYYSMNTLMKQ